MCLSSWRGNVLLKQDLGTNLLVLMGRSSPAMKWGFSPVPSAECHPTPRSGSCIFCPCQPKPNKSQNYPETQAPPSSEEKSVPRHNSIPKQPAIRSFQSHLHFVNWSFPEAQGARGDPDHSSRGSLSQTLPTELGLGNKELHAAAPALLPWQLPSRNKTNPHALRTLLCQNLLRKYLSSTIINRKYSDLFSVAALQSFYIAGLQPTKAKTQNKQNKNKVPLSSHKGNSGYLLK